MRSSLKDICDKHPGLIIVFKGPGISACERCLAEVDDKAYMATTNLTETTVDDAKQSLFGQMMQEPAP